MSWIVLKTLEIKGDLFGAGNPKTMAKVSLKRLLIFTSQKLFLFENLLRLVSSSTYNLLDFISMVKKNQFMITERSQNCRFNKCLAEIWGNFNTARSVYTLLLKRNGASLFHYSWLTQITLISWTLPYLQLCLYDQWTKLLHTFLKVPQEQVQSNNSFKRFTLLSLFPTVTVITFQLIIIPLRFKNEQQR